MAKRKTKSSTSTWIWLWDGPVLLITHYYPELIAKEELIRALATRGRRGVRWRAEAEDRQADVGSAWKRLSGKGGVHFSPHVDWEGNWVEFYTKRGRCIAYRIEVVYEDVLRLLPKRARPLPLEPPPEKAPPPPPPLPLPPLSEPEREVRPKPKGRAGVEPTYVHTDIKKIAEEACKAGCDRHRSWFYARVRDMCREHRPPIKTPDNDRTMGRIIGDLYRPPSADSR